MVKIDISTEPRIVRYQDKNNVFASADFWRGREYDHRAEEIVVKKYFKKYFSKQPEDSWLVDLGGAFGRLLPSYAPFFKEVAVLDYAVSEFYKAVEIAQAEEIKLHLIAGNVYHLPFKDASQTALTAVRLIHHVEDPLWFFEEVDRILKPGGILICEAANKNNLKTLIQAILKLDFSVWNLNWLDIGAKGIQEDGHFALIRNYNPVYLEESLKELDLKIVRRSSTSWLRNITALQKLPGVMYFLERPLQWLGSFLPLGPSNWYVIKKIGRDQSDSDARTGFLSTLCLPKSKKPIPKEEQPRYIKQTEKGIDFLDLRYPKA